LRIRGLVSVVPIAIRPQKQAAEIEFASDKSLTWRTTRPMGAKATELAIRHTRRRAKKEFIFKWTILRADSARSRWERLGGRRSSIATAEAPLNFLQAVCPCCSEITPPESSVAVIASPPILIVIRRRQSFIYKNYLGPNAYSQTKTPDASPDFVRTAKNIYSRRMGMKLEGLPLVTHVLRLDVVLFVKSAVPVVPDKAHRLTRAGVGSEFIPRL
jgi:hypothetical protein